MATARGMFDAAKHPRGFHGHFGTAGAARRTFEIKGGRRKETYTPLVGESLFAVKAGRFGRTRTPHGKKLKVQFNKLVYDPVKRDAVTVRRFVTRY